MKSKKIVLCGLFCAFGVLLPQAFHIEKVSVLSVWTAVVSGMPGIVIQLVFIPPLVMAVKKYAKTML